MQSITAKLYQAINEEDREGIIEIISSHPDELNTHTVMAGQTWLGYAAQIGKLMAVKVLHGLGSDINIGETSYGAKPICSACLNGHSQVAQYLIENGSDIDTDRSARNPLFSSIVGQSADCVRVLLTAGIDPAIRYNSDTMTDMDAMAFAMMRGERECAEIIAHWIARDEKLVADELLSEADEIAERNASA